MRCRGRLHTPQTGVNEKIKHFFGVESVEKKIGKKKINKKNDFPVKIRHGTK